MYEIREQLNSGSPERGYAEPFDWPAVEPALINDACTVSEKRFDGRQILLKEVLNQTSSLFLLSGCD